MTSVYFYGAVYKTTETTNKDGNTLVSMNRINNKGLTQKEYAKKLAAGEITDSEIAPSDYNAYQAVTFIGGGYLLIDWGSCSNSATETLRNTLISTFPYSSYSSILNPLYYSIYASKTIEASHPLNKILQDSEGGDAAQMWNLYTMGDSYYVSYFNSDSDLVALARWTRNYYQAYSATPDFVAYNASNTWYQNPTTDVIDTSALDESAPYGSQYFNFYKYAALSYSYRRRERGSTLYSFVDDNIQHPLYIKNKYLRALKSTDKVNLSDAYVRIPLWGDRDNTT